MGGGIWDCLKRTLKDGLVCQHLWLVSEKRLGWGALGVQSLVSPKLTGREQMLCALKGSRFLDTRCAELLLALLPFLKPAFGCLAFAIRAFL